jgi:hypothetical protein
LRRHAREHEPVARRPAGQQVVAGAGGELTAGTSFIAKGAPMATQSGPTVLYDTGTGLLSYD